MKPFCPEFMPTAIKHIRKAISLFIAAKRQILTFPELKIFEKLASDYHLPRSFFVPLRLIGADTIYINNSFTKTFKPTNAVSLC